MQGKRTWPLFFFFSILKVKGEKQKASPLSARGDLDSSALVSRARPFGSLDVS